jgi:hypothetical protein
MMNAETEKRVHEVVFWGDGVEMPPHPLDLIVDRDLFETEMGCFTPTDRAVIGLPSFLPGSPDGFFFEHLLILLCLNHIPLGNKTIVIKKVD